ncbi:MAG TPA: hypothetical protein VNL16_12695, partial [Chloroflexota bacterium]|nr:hypothetical protein [Chloroflexota bacterium]
MRRDQPFALTLLHDARLITRFLHRFDQRFYIGVRVAAKERFATSGARRNPRGSCLGERMGHVLFAT